MFMVIGLWVMVFLFCTFLSKFSAVRISYFYNMGEDFLMKTWYFDLLVE